MRFPILLSALSLLATTASTASIHARQSPSEIFKLPGTGGWLEVIAARANGHLLLSRFDKNELWAIDPVTRQGSLSVSFPNSTAVTGIAEISPDVFAVVTGKVSLSAGITISAGTWGIWKVDFTSGTPVSKFVKLIPEAGFIIGITPLRGSNDTILVADAGKGSLYNFNVSSAAYSLLVTDPTMKAPAGSFIAEGIHGIKIYNNTLYFTNTFANTFYKVPIDTATGRISGTPSKINAQGISSPGDIAVVPDGSVYIAQLQKNNVLKVSPGGVSSVVASVTSPASVAFGRGERDGRTLYVSTTGGTVVAVNIP